MNSPSQKRGTKNCHLHLHPQNSFKSTKDGGSHQVMIDLPYDYLEVSGWKLISTWNPKQQDFYGCFNWMIPNLYLGNGCFTKRPCKTGCLGFQVVCKLMYNLLAGHVKTDLHRGYNLFPKYLSTTVFHRCFSHHA